MASEGTAYETEQELVAGVIAGHEGAFDTLYGRYRDRIYRFSVKRLRDAAEAEDVTQEVFLQVHRCLPSFEGRSSLLTWMFGIAHNQVCRRFRRQRPPMVSMDDSPSFELPAAEVSADRRIDAARILDRCQEVLEEEVSATQRMVFHLRYAENRSTRDIAEKLGKSNQAVKIGLFRSRRALERRSPDLDVALTAA
ncbi:MAG: RNA polymerase sigma factor [Myxococcota bacterium]